MEHPSQGPVHQCLHHIIMIDNCKINDLHYTDFLGVRVVRDCFSRYVNSQWMNVCCLKNKTSFLLTKRNTCSVNILYILVVDSLKCQLDRYFKMSFPQEGMSDIFFCKQFTTFFLGKSNSNKPWSSQNRNPESCLKVEKSIQRFMIKCGSSPIISHAIIFFLSCLHRLLIVNTNMLLVRVGFQTLITNIELKKAHSTYSNVKYYTNNNFKKECSNDFQPKLPASVPPD